MNTNYVHTDDWTFSTEIDMDEMANILLKENIQAYQDRYPDNMENIDANIKYSRQSQITSIPALLKALSCYEYQTDESKGWKTSRAKAIIDAIRTFHIPFIAGYEEAEYHID
ncbi:MAG: hypothetical protein GY765_15120 [bacterium]|nr:hypothetical protein [bacterium]